MNLLVDNRKEGNIIEDNFYSPIGIAQFKLDLAEMRDHKQFDETEYWRIESEILQDIEDEKNDPDNLERYL